MKCYDIECEEEADYTAENIFDYIKDYDEILVERDDGQAMWNISGPTLEDAEYILEQVKNGAKVECTVYFDDDGNNISDDEARDLENYDYEKILALQPLDYED